MITQPTSTNTSQSTEPTQRQRTGLGHRTLGRNELLGAGVAALMVGLMPAGLARAAAPKTPSPLATVPASSLLQGYPQLYQQHSLSCEAAVASMATGGRVTEQQILDNMPYNANPYLGFRGNVDGGQSLANGLVDYGIYAPPLARELQRFGYQTQVLTGSTAPALLRHSIGVLGRPVEVWVTHYLGDYPAITGYAGGASFILIDGEHARLAIGYDDYGIHQKSGKGTPGFSRGGELPSLHPPRYQTAHTRT